MGHLQALYKKRDLKAEECHKTYKGIAHMTIFILCVSD
jgi:hypothetical protein